MCPFGLAAIFRTKMRDLIGAVYLELCMVQSYSAGFTAGQAMIMENVSGMCDRVLPFHPTEVVGTGEQRVDRSTVDAVIGFTEDTLTLGNEGLMGNESDFAPTNRENEGGA